MPPPCWRPGAIALLLRPAPRHFRLVVPRFGLLPHSPVGVEYRLSIAHNAAPPWPSRHLAAAPCPLTPLYTDQPPSLKSLPHIKQTRQDNSAPNCRVSPIPGPRVSLWVPGLAGGRRLYVGHGLLLFGLPRSVRRF